MIKFEGQHCFNCGVDYDLSIHHLFSKVELRKLPQEERAKKIKTIILCRNCHDLIEGHNKIPTMISTKLKEKIDRMVEK